MNLTSSIFGQAELTLSEYVNLTRKLVSALRNCADECGGLRMSRTGELDWRAWDETAMDIQDLLTDDLVSVAL